MSAAKQMAMMLKIPHLFFPRRGGPFLANHTARVPSPLLLQRPPAHPEQVAQHETMIAFIIIIFYFHFFSIQFYKCMCVNAPVGWSPLRIHAQFLEHPLAVCSAANGPCCSWATNDSQHSFVCCFHCRANREEEASCTGEDTRMCFYTTHNAAVKSSPSSPCFYCSS